MRSGNPTLKADTFTGFTRTSDAMTVSGTVNRTFILLLLLVGGAAYTWCQVYDRVGMISPLVIWGPAILAFGIAIAIVMRKQWAPLLAPIYAVVEGLCIGAISAMFEIRYPGIVVQAVGLTFTTMFALLLAYRSGVIRATENFRLGVTSATMGIALFYLAGFVLSFFNIQIPFIHDSGPIGIGVSIVIVTIAALNLVLDFDFIEQGERAGAPKFMEWYAAFGLMVTLVWLYLEILRLLSKTRDRK